MRYVLGIIAAAALCAACGPGMNKGANSAVIWSTDSVSAGHLEQLYRSIGDTSVVGEVDVKYPLFEGGPVADSLNAGVLRTIAAAFGYEGATPETVAGVVDTVVRGLVADLPGREIGYYLMTKGDVVRYGGVISVRLSVSTFMGGAHGLDQVLVLNYDAGTGSPLTSAQMFADLPQLTAMNRKAFLRYLQDLGENPDSVCLFIPVDSLPLPQNILVDSAGIEMHYNPYEVACYAFGPTDYTLPMQEAAATLGNIYR